MTIYTASKTVHAPRWRALRAVGYPIISTWIDEAGQGETQSFEDLWCRCVSEAAAATVTIVYREAGEVLKGAFVEVGAALAGGKRVIAVGCEGLTFTHHRFVTTLPSLDEAFTVASRMEPRS